MQLIANLQNRTEDFCIATDNLVQPFDITYVRGKQISILRRVIFISLEPKEETILAVTFKPIDYGTYKILLPICYKRENGPEFHRALIITGNYVRPVIEIEKIFHVRREISLPHNLDPPQLLDFSGLRTVFFCRPLPLGVRSQSSKKFLFKNHLNDCRITTSTDLDFLVITLDTKTISVISAVDYVVKIYFLCEPKENKVYTGTVTVQCSCGGYWRATVTGCTENSFLTSYAFSEAILPNEFREPKSVTKGIGLLTSSTPLPALSSAPSINDAFRPERLYAVEFFSSYPFFPLEEGPLFSFMVKTHKACEEWICSQGFFQKSYYEIPNRMLAVDVGKKDVKSKKKPNIFVPFAQLLINLVGPQMEEYLDLQPDPDDEIELIHIILNIYERILDFLVKRGASFTYLRAEHLLEYSRFIIYKEIQFPQDQNPSAITLSLNNIEQYYHFAKQSWTDLFLQTFKVLCIHRIETELQTKLKEKIGPSGHPFNGFLENVKNTLNSSNLFSFPEVLIMRWLEYHFNSNKHILFPGATLKERKVDMFGNGFEDGLILTAVTLVYCPYLRPHFKNIYAPASSTEEVNHNYNNLLNCWERLMFSYKLSANDFLEFHSIQLLMFSAYLYNVLPHMYPVETIEFKAGLSQTKTLVLRLSNKNCFPIAYKPIVIPFDTEGFTVNKDIYIIKPNGSCDIKITYYAKYAKIIKATLLLSGECFGYHYSKNKALSLIGTPDLTEVTMTINQPVKLYECRYIKFAIKSPYVKEATYNLRISYAPIKTIEQLESTHMHWPQLQRLSTGRFTPRDNTFHFDKDGSCVMHGLLTVLRNIDMYLYLFFNNPDIGDFVILISLLISGKVPEEVLKVKFPKNIDFERQSYILQIPSKNTKLWNVVKTLILELTKGSERKFWEKVVDTEPGMLFASNILGDVPVFSKLPILKLTNCLPLVYSVKCRSNDVILPRYVTIQQECEKGFVKVPIKILKKRPANFSFTMSTEDGIQRVYYVRFLSQDTR